LEQLVQVFSGQMPYNTVLHYPTFLYNQSLLFPQCSRLDLWFPQHNIRDSPQTLSAIPAVGELVFPPVTQ